MQYSLYVTRTTTWDKRVHPIERQHAKMSKKEFNLMICHIYDVDDWGSTYALKEEKTSNNG